MFDKRLADAELGIADDDKKEEKKPKKEKKKEKKPKKKKKGKKLKKTKAAIDEIYYAEPTKSTAELEDKIKD